MDFSLGRIGALDGDFILDNPILEFAQELDMIFNIKPHELSCDQFAGKVNLSGIVHNRTINAQQLERIVRSEIDQFTEGSSLFTYDIDIRFTKGTSRDIVIVTTTINNPIGNDVTNTYIFR